MVEYPEYCTVFIKSSTIFEATFGHHIMSQTGGSVSIVTRAIGMDSWSIIVRFPVAWKFCVFSAAPRQTLEPTQPHVHWPAYSGSYEYNASACSQRLHPQLMFKKDWSYTSMRKPSLIADFSVNLMQFSFLKNLSMGHTEMKKETI
jgi:hypothetical protein